MQLGLAQPLQNPAPLQESPIERTSATQDNGSGIDEQELVRLFGILSHDLKSPIFAVDGFSELLLSDYADKLDEDGQDFLRRIRSSAQNMKHVLDDMSHMVKLLARPNTLRTVPLVELIEEVMQKCNYAIDEGRVTITVPENLPMVTVDPEKMREAIGAILSNALMFTDREKGDRRVVFEHAPAGERHRLCIRDNGIGIDPRYVSQIFELGGVSKLDKARGGGPGYGLYLAKKIVEGHGGALTVDSVPDEGTSFCFTVPG